MEGRARSLGLGKRQADSFGEGVTYDCGFVADLDFLLSFRPSFRFHELAYGICVARLEKAQFLGSWAGWNLCWNWNCNNTLASSASLLVDQPAA